MAKAAAHAIHAEGKKPTPVAILEPPDALVLNHANKRLRLWGRGIRRDECQAYQ
jgi:hypothetical protein